VQERIAENRRIAVFCGFYSDENLPSRERSRGKF
jgi:hypothetical protein